MKNNIYISPHLDDVVFSCGSIIHNQIKNGEKVTIVTVFAGIPLMDLKDLTIDVKKFVTDSGFHDLVSMYNFRRDEDFNAINTLGDGKITHLNLDFLESIYRTDMKGHLMYKTFNDVFSYKIHRDDMPITKLSKIIAKILKNLDGEHQLYFPIPISGHVDHIIVKKVGNSMQKERLNVIYYEEIYTIDHEINKYIINYDHKLGISCYIEVQADDIEAHSVSMNKYISQIDRMQFYAKKKTYEMVEILNSRQEGMKSFRLWNY